jgi:hypothetical protein
VNTRILGGRLIRERKKLYFGLKMLENGGLEGLDGGCPWGIRCFFKGSPLNQEPFY